MRVIVASRLEREPMVLSLIAGLLRLGITDWLKYDTETYSRLSGGKSYVLSAVTSEHLRRHYSSGQELNLLDSWDYPQDDSGFNQWLCASMGIEAIHSESDLPVTGDEERDKLAFYRFLADNAVATARAGTAESHKLSQGYVSLYGQARGWIKQGNSVTVDQSQKLIVNEATKAMELARDTAKRMEGKCVKVT